MRRGQKHRRTPQDIAFRRPPNPLAALTQPIIYGCALPPKATLAHKYVKVLKRMVKGGVTLLNSWGTYQWYKGSKALGKVKTELIKALKKLGYIHNIGGDMLITAAGRKAIGEA